jgi:N-(2-amino-2-carboxyethyl)-L-glutamate synthase
MAAAGVRYRVGRLIGNTPIVELSLLVGGAGRLLRLKLESYNPCGSLKDRIAAALIDQVVDEVDSAVGIIESTSGNLGVAMAAECRRRGIAFNAVVDPRASVLLIDRMRGLGAQVTIVDEPDSSGGYLLNRIRYVHGQLAARPGLIWTNQYNSEANPGAHFATTAPELHRQVPGPATILVPVSTGGTLAGLTRYARTAGVPWRLIGVDVAGSAALGRPPGQRLLSGIGASCPSSFLDPDGAEAVHVTAAEAITACLWLSGRAGLDVGGSSGATVAAALRMFGDDPEAGELVCLCPDGADRYLTTIYEASWRAAHGVGDTRTGDGVELLRVQYPAARREGPHV